MSALRFFYKKVLKRRDLTLKDLVYPKKPKKLPVVLSQEEVTGLDTANGKVLAQCRSRHRHQEYLSFLREIEKNVPKNLEAHIIVGIITPRISIAEFGAGSPRDHDFMCTLLPPMPPGSIRWRSGSIASRNKPYAGEPSAA